MEENTKRDIRYLAEAIRELLKRELGVSEIDTQLKKLSTDFGYGVFSVFLRIVFQLDLTPKEGLSLWKELVLYYNWISDRSGGMDYRAIFLDYLIRKKKLIKTPVSMELESYDKTIEATFTDEMTKVYNLRFFRQSLEREIKRAGRSEKTCSLLFLDIDHFKKINDKFGHPVGDEVLKAVAGVMMESARVTDFPARYGGEEFAILAPDTEQAGAILLAERIRKKVEGLRIPELKGEQVTVSVGVACYPYHASSAAELVTRADRALYSAKSSGRNKVQAYELAQEKRVHVRHPVQIKGSAAGNTYKATIPFRTKNVSHRGLLCETTTSIRVGTALELHLDVGHGEWVRCFGLVVHARKPISHHSFEVGLFITEIAHQDEQKFDLFVGKLELFPQFPPQ